MSCLGLKVQCLCVVGSSRILMRPLSICQNWPARPVSSKTECTNLKDNFYPSILNSFKIVRTIFGVIILQDFAAPSLQNVSFDFQTDGANSDKWKTP